MKINIGGWAGRWFQVESDFQSAQVIANIIYDVINIKNSYINNNLEPNELSLKIFNAFVNKYSDTNLYEADKRISLESRFGKMIDKDFEKVRDDKKVEIVVYDFTQDILDKINNKVKAFHETIYNDII